MTSTVFNLEAILNTVSLPPCDIAIVNQQEMNAVQPDMVSGRGDAFAQDHWADDGGNNLD
jgi:hypothetical protein